MAAILLTLITPAIFGYTAAPASASPRKEPFPKPSAQERVTLGKAREARKVTTAKPYKKFDPSAKSKLPAAKSATVKLPETAAARGTSAANSRSWVRAGDTPVSLARASSGSAPSQVRVSTVDPSKAKAAGVTGVLFTVESTAGTGGVGVDVDSSTFRNAYGGGYASRLRLVQLPACALTTPELDRCRTQTPLTTKPGTPLSADLSLTSASSVSVLAATSSSDGSSGDFSATSLSAGGSWSGGGSTGAFTYKYPISAPPPLGGAAPEIELSYSSSSVDARTSATNNQSSWIGDGWKSSEHYIERTYKGCRDVKDSGAPTGSGDVCWAGQLLTLSLDGSSTQIVYDDDTKTFRPAEDDSKTKIERLSGATNGTKNGEHFRVTIEGVQYYFGLNRLPGWATGEEETRSVWTMPVYKANGGVSDCPTGDFGDTACTLGYRFNLDYVVDPYTNATAYFYTPEMGLYGANKKKDKPVSYVRDGFLKRIDYGMRASTIFSAAVPAQIVFNTDERCIVGRPAGNECTDEQFTNSHPEYWPDTPVDLNCVSGKDCDKFGASFWSRKRLTSIVTQARVNGAMKPVSRYDLVQTFPDGGDHAPTLWLESIKHTGLDRLGGGDKDLSAGTVSFNPIQLPNRVGTVPGLPPMQYNRILNVTSEAGAETTVDYELPNCSSVPASDLNDEKDTKAQEFASTNTTACFPVYWAPEGQPRPLLDWFYTHPVKRVSTIDKYNAYQDGTQPKLVTEYLYKGGAAWHYDDNELVKKKNRTWGQFRGYGEVETRTGDPSVFHYVNGQPVHDQKTSSTTYYFRGMNGDTLPDGKTRPAKNLTSTDGAISVPDDNRFAGQTFEVVKLDRVGGEIDSAKVTVPTAIGPTASRSRDGLPALTANMVRPFREVARERVSYGWRTTESRTFYNTTLGQSTTGMAVQNVDRGEVGAAGNVAKCTFTKYLDGTAATVVKPAEVIVTQQDCATAGATASGTLISHSRSSFDGNPFAVNGATNPARPTRGDITAVQEASTATGATATAFLTTSTSTYDGYGRKTSETRNPNSKAADGTTSLARTVFTRRTPASGALPVTVTTVTQVQAGTDCSAVTTSSKECQLSTEVLNPVRGDVMTETDAAGGVTSMKYDSLGRLTAVWLANKSKADGAPPNMIYEYKNSATSPSVTTTKTLVDAAELGDAPAYRVSKVLHDAMLRKLETQETGENGTVVVSDTQYDSLGQIVLTNNAYAAVGNPSDSLVSDRLSQVSIPATTTTDYDALGQSTRVTEHHKGVAKWQTRTAYTGDTETVFTPAGGVINTKVTDARDRLTQFKQYTVTPAIGGSHTTGYTATGGTANVTKYEYDHSGRRTKVIGADNTTWSWTYDLRGREISQSDPDTGLFYTKYDDAGNTIATKDARGIELTYTHDLAGRKLTGVNKSRNNFKFVSYEYDTLRIGKATSTTRYVSGVTGGYTVAYTGYSTLGKPLGQKITLPSVESPLPLEFTNKFRYTQDTEALAQHEAPAVGGLPGETISYGRNLLGAPTRTAGIETYIGSTLYTDFGQLSRVTMGASSNEAQVLYSYDEYTLRLSGRTVHRSQGIGPLVDEMKYSYDDSGNPLSVVNEQSETGSTFTDTQCYRYDALNRLVQAWTAKDACPAAGTAEPAAGTLATGPGAYWQSFGYNAIGNRTGMVEHSTNGGADVTTGYTNGCTTGCNRTGAQPHTLTSTTGVDPTTFVYDVSGNLLTRTAASGNGQNLKWDDEGMLAEVTTTGASSTVTKYLYDADGNQLIRRDPGRTTLFAGDTQVVVDTSVTPAVVLGAVRTYTHGGDSDAIAVRSTLPGGGVQYLINDRHGTGVLAMDTTTQQISRQQTKPYGESRTTANPSPWPDQTRGYLGKPKSVATGYSDLGARKYDPALGRFISADPVLDPSDPNQLGGYTYAGSNPILSSDPGGKMLPPEDRAPGRDATGKKTGGGSSGSGNGNGGGSKSSGSTTTGGSRTPSTGGGAPSYNVPIPRPKPPVLPPPPPKPKFKDPLASGVSGGVAGPCTWVTVATYYQAGCGAITDGWTGGAEAGKMAAEDVAKNKYATNVFKNHWMADALYDSNKATQADAFKMKTWFNKNGFAKGVVGSAEFRTPRIPLGASAFGKQSMKGMKVVPGIGLALNVVGAVDVYNTEMEQGKSRGQAIAAGGANLAGALAGAAAGAKMGALAGAAIGGPVGALVGGIVGGAVGGVIGGGLAHKAVDKIWSLFD
ncbi:type IV secretion protein Rhs [Actinoplanes italicus]|uniref:RHS repeat-associated protein n=1 Tax=Actinoplanes italicus TaxID=113567 RepID=A0A2T0K6K7_9ACTN|nr:RHS repeat-associated core domain-containing protein [Actinoplanes italicus]PRX18641.1 RHS repeat-associated protein [Actinoplanes italicus]GIE32982.1 type IV secretion protein Rhs [Actinoplanes italicus]